MNHYNQGTNRKVDFCPVVDVELLVGHCPSSCKNDQQEWHLNLRPSLGDLTQDVKYHHTFPVSTVDTQMDGIHDKRGNLRAYTHKHYRMRA